MSHFSELLTAFTKRAGISSTQVAGYSGLDRVTVYRFMKGKTLPKDKETVLLMAEVLRLTSDEREVLAEAYESTRLGPRVYWERRYIRSFMRSFSGAANMVPLIQYDTEDVEEPRREAMPLGGRDSTIKRIQKEILGECEGADGEISLVMRPGIMVVMDMLLSAGKRNKSLRVRHLIPIANNYISGFDESAASLLRNAAPSNPGNTRRGTEENSVPSFWAQNTFAEGESTTSARWLHDGEKDLRQEQGWNHELLQSFFKVISMCAEGFDYAPSYFYSRNAEINHFPVYSNLMLTKRSAILFTDDLEESILFCASDQVAGFREKFKRLAEGKPALSYVFRDVETFMENMNNVILGRSRRKEDVEYCYYAQPCILPMLTNEIIQKHLRTELFSQPLAGGTQVLENIYHYVDAIRSRYEKDDYNQINFISESGVRHFLKTGRFAEIPLELYSPLTEKERRQMILKLAEHPHFKTCIIKNELSAPEGMLCIEVMDKFLFLEYLVPGKGMCFLYINEPGVLLAFRNFFRDFPKDEICSEEESREILRRIAQEEI